jgi:cation/acetate symporter
MLIVVTAGMVSTTYVQFLKGSLLVIFSFVLTLMILNRGLQAPVEAESPDPAFTVGNETYQVAHSAAGTGRARDLLAGEYTALPATGAWQDRPYVRLKHKQTDEISTWRKVGTKGASPIPVTETQTVTDAGAKNLINGLPQGHGPGELELTPVGRISKLPDAKTATGPLGPLEFLSTLQQSEVVVWEKDPKTITDADGAVTTVYYPKVSAGKDLLRPGNHPAFKGIRSPKWADKLNFLSLMLALFGGTASLPHILIRYYTVKDQASARKSTIVGIASIGFFYILTLYMGLGAMTSGALDVTNSNMAAPLLAKSMNEWLFAIISAIAFTTVLGTVSGLIIAASGAVVHDLMSSFLRIEMTEHIKIRCAKLASIVVGIIAIVLGIVFEKVNVNYLVGWAFSVAASANLPSLVMLLFWKRTTKQGITAAITVGMVSSLAWILLSGDTFKDIYKLDPALAPVPFSQPGIVTIPLGFVVLILVSLMTRRKTD